MPTLALIIGCAVLLACGLLLISKFPFRQSAVVARVQKAANAQVAIGVFQEHWFPPGFSARDVRLTNAAGDSLVIPSIEVKASYAGLLARPSNIGQISATGVRLVIRPQNRGNRNIGAGTGIAANDIRVSNATLILLPASSNGKPLEFDIHSLAFRNFGTAQPIAFEASLRNPIPAGEIHARGEFGPLATKTLSITPFNGTFTFDHADLKADHALTGTLNASGKFSGPLEHLTVLGAADVPNFHVERSAHTVQIHTTFNATVDALNGNTALNGIVARFNNTTVNARGTVASDGLHPGKTLTLDTSIAQGRIQDLLLLFTSAPAAALDGAVRLGIRFIFPPGPPGFLTRLKADGAFEIDNSKFTNPKAQVPIEDLSASAVQKRRQNKNHDDPPSITETIRGNVHDLDGIATLSTITFQTPGINGNLAGTFDLRKTAIDFKGTLDTTGQIADTTGGFKSALLHVLAPLFEAKKRGREKVFPFTINGTAAHPQFHLVPQD